MQRYSVINDKNPREIVLLRGQGCRYKRCAFCDYHLDACADEMENLAVNRKALEEVSGKYGVLEVINSGSFTELDESTIKAIEETALEKKIHQIHFECHWIYRSRIPAFRERFGRLGIRLKIKQGVESFDAEYREKVLLKGIREEDPKKIAENYDECCLLFGLSGQTVSSMRKDLETGLNHFERVCINIMNPNTTPIHPDPEVIRAFRREIYPDYIDDPRVDILMDNTDFGVGGEDTFE